MSEVSFPEFSGEKTHLMDHIASPACGASTSGFDGKVVDVLGRQRCFGRVDYVQHYLACFVERGDGEIVGHRITVPRQPTNPGYPITASATGNDPPAKAEFDGVVIKLKAPSTGNRQPSPQLGVLTRPPHPSLKCARSWMIHIDDAMAIDAAPSTPLTNAKRAYRPSTVTASNVIKYDVQRADLSKRTASYLNVKTDIREEEDSRVFKKRRTSSDVPDEAKLLE